MKKINKKIIFLLIIIILIVLVITAFLFNYYRNKNYTPGEIKNFNFFHNQETINNKGVDVNVYKKELKEAVNYVMASINDQKAIEESKNKILALQVPAEYRQLHLDLVIALTHLEQSDKFEQGQRELEKIIKDNDWLK